jgi:predicted RNA-binding protein with PUA domain
MTRVLLENKEWLALKELLNQGIWLVKVRNPFSSNASVFFYREFHPASAKFDPNPVLEKVRSLVKSPELMHPDLAEIEILSKEKKKYFLSRVWEREEEEESEEPVAVARFYSFQVHDGKPRIEDQSFLLVVEKNKEKTSNTDQNSRP